MNESLLFHINPILTLNMGCAKYDIDWQYCVLQDNLYENTKPWLDFRIEILGNNYFSSIQVYMEYYYNIIII